MAALCISATFLTGQYHGREWPPSPARLLQALVAGVRNGGNGVVWPQVEEGLRWLECQPAPRIYARSDKRLTRYRVAVPNNDFDVIAKDWAAGRSASLAAIKTMKSVAPRLIEGPVPHLRYTWEVSDPDEGLRVAGLLRPAVHCLYSLGWGVDMAYGDAGLSGDGAGAGWDEWVPSAVGERKAIPVPGFL